MIDKIRKLIERENERIDISRKGHGNSSLFYQRKMENIDESEDFSYRDLKMLHECDMELIKNLAEAVIELENRLVILENKLGINQKYKIYDYDKVD